MWVYPIFKPKLINNPHTYTTHVLLSHKTFCVTVSLRAHNSRTTGQILMMFILASARLIEDGFLNAVTKNSSFVRSFAYENYLVSFDRLSNANFGLKMYVLYGNVVRGYRHFRFPYGWTDLNGNNSSRIDCSQYLRCVGRCQSRLPLLKGCEYQYVCNNSVTGR